MEAYPYSNSNSSSSSSKSSYLTQNHEAKSIQSLHSVRKSQAKPWKKAPVAPPPPAPVKVYKVDPVNFRDLVQQLTGAPECKPQLLRTVTPTTTSPNTKWSGRDNNIAAATNWYMS